MDISMNNVENKTNEPKPAEVVESQKLPSLLDAEITDENKALNVIISFVYLAQKRGAFNLQESAKIWECVQLFTKTE